MLVEHEVMLSDDSVKGNPAGPGGSLTRRPTWSNPEGVGSHRFFSAFGGTGRSQSPGTNPMDKSNLTMAQQVADAAGAFERRRTGHVPESVAVVLGEETLVITLHGALSPAERALARTPEGAAQLQEFHRQLFNDSAD